MLITSPKKTGCALIRHTEEFPRSFRRFSCASVWKKERERAHEPRADADTLLPVRSVTVWQEETKLVSWETWCNDWLSHSHSPTHPPPPPVLEGRWGGRRRPKTTRNSRNFYIWHVPISRSESDASLLVLIDWIFDSTRVCVCVFCSLTDNVENLQPLVQQRFAELLRALKAIIRKHQTLNSVDILGAAGAVIAKVKGQWKRGGTVTKHVFFRPFTVEGPVKACLEFSL